jgi:hypothetical protein
LKSGTPVCANFLLRPEAMRPALPNRADKPSEQQN